MSNELQDIIIIIDTREQNQKRIAAVENWGTTHGALIEHKKLDHLDYSLIGEFRGHEINLGIETKALSQFVSDTYEENKMKLFNACDVYNEVALFIEVGNYEFSVDGFGETNIQCRVKNDLILTGRLSMLEGCCSTLPRYGIHVRQLRSEAQFPYSIENLLTYIIHSHVMISKRSIYEKKFSQTLSTFMTPLQVRKVRGVSENMTQLCGADMNALQDLLGKKSGLQVYTYLRHHDFDIALPSPSVPTIDIDKSTEGLGLTTNPPPNINIPSVPFSNHSDLFSKKSTTTSDDDTTPGNSKINTTKTTPNPLESVQSSEFKTSTHCVTSGSAALNNDNNTKNTMQSSGPILNNSNTITPLSKPDSATLHISKAQKRTSSSNKTKIKSSVALSNLSSSATFDDNRFDTDEKLFGDLRPVFICRYCYKEITSTEDNESGFHEACFEEAKTDRMNLRHQLIMYFETAHTLQETQDSHKRWSKAYVYEMVMRMKRDNEIVQFDDKTFVRVTS